MKPDIIAYQKFYGGIATDYKVGIKDSHAYSRAIDFRKRPGQMSPLPGTRRFGSNNVKDLIQQIIQTEDGTRYGLGNEGYFYSIDDDDVVVKAKLDDGAAGMLYRKDLQEMYMTSSTTVSYYGKFPNPVIDINKYAESASEDDAALLSGGTNTYTLGTSIVESPTTIQEFESDIEPLVRIRVRVASKGTGDWTLTLHDDANNVLATSTVASANISNNADLDFNFSDQIRLYVKPSARTYHFHLTSTVADGTVYCATTNDLNTCDFSIFADRLVRTNNGVHPIVQFLQYVCICNERYLSVWEPLADIPSNLEWKRHRLDFGPGYESCGATITDEYIVIACERRSTSDDHDFQEGRLFFWDGLSEQYNFTIEIQEGSPEAIYTYQNLVYMIIGGALYVWAGGKNIIKLRTLLNTDTEFSGITDTTRVYPNMMAVRRNILLLGYPSVTASETIEHGVFSHGSVDKNYPMSFGYNYVLSTKTRLYDGSNALRIGCVRNFGDTLYIAWRDDTQPESFKYGVDIVDNTSLPAAEGTWEARAYDGEAVFKMKSARYMKLTCAPLPEGVRIKMKYKVDHGDWVYPDDGVLEAGDTYKIAKIGERNHEIQVGFDWETPDEDNPATEPFVVTCEALDTDLLKNEGPFKE
jgi:hypothetical protein